MLKICNFQKHVILQQNVIIGQLYEILNLLFSEKNWFCDKNVLLTVFTKKKAMLNTEISQQKKKDSWTLNCNYTKFTLSQHKIAI